MFFRLLCFIFFLMILFLLGQNFVLREFETYFTRLFVEIRAQVNENY